MKPLRLLFVRSISALFLPILCLDHLYYWLPPLTLHLPCHQSSRHVLVNQDCIFYMCYVSAVMLCKLCCSSQYVARSYGLSKCVRENPCSFIETAIIGMFYLILSISLMYLILYVKIAALRKPAAVAQLVHPQYNGPLYLKCLQWQNYTLVPYSAITPL